MKINRFFLIIISAVAFSLLAISCNNSEKEDSLNPLLFSYALPNPIENSIPNIPVCLTQTGSSTARQAMHIKDDPTYKDVKNVFSPITATLSFINEFLNREDGSNTDGLKHFIADISKGLSNLDHGDITTDDGIRIVWEPNNGEYGDYEHKLVAYYNDEKYLETFITINNTAGTAKGTITFDLSKSPENLNGIIRVVFDGGTDPKSIDIMGTDISDISAYSPSKARISMEVHSDNIFNLKGNYYFPELEFFNEERNYVFTATGYHESSFINSNKAMLNLALPPSDLSTIDGMLDNYSVGEVFTTKARETVIANLPDAAYNLIRTWASDLDLPADKNDLTNSQLIALLEYAIENLSAIEALPLEAILFITDLVNPAYFISTGFVGTWNETLHKGTLEAKPEGFENLNLSAVEPTIPADVKNMTISFISQD